MNLFQALRRRLRRDAAKRDVELDDADQIEGVLRDFPAGTIRFWVPTERVCMHGAWRYGGGWHPFTEMLAGEGDNLDGFYRRFCPATLAEMYFIPKQGRNGEDLPPWTLPWLPLQGNAPIPEMGLGLEHGVSYYGPASPEKVALEERRLTGTLNSIQSSGYNPSARDDLTGWFLARGKETRFFVRGGKHRAAVLAYLGWKRIPVTLREAARPTVKAAPDDIRDWPLVREGRLDPRLAATILDRYFDWNGEQQRRLLPSIANA